MTAAAPNASRGTLARPPRMRVLLGLLLFAAAVATAIALVDVERVVAALGAVTREPVAVVTALTAYTAAFWLRAMAARFLLGRATSAATLFSILQAGLVLNHVLPLKAGDLSRPLLLARQGVPLATAVTGTVLARALDLAALLLIAIVANGSLATRSVGPLALAALLLAAGLLVIPGAQRLPLPLRLRARVSPLLEARDATRGRELAAAVPLVLLSWMLEAGMVLAAATLLDLELAAGVAIGVTAFTILFQVVHLTPGGLGIYETSMTGILVLHGLPPEDALVLAVLTHGLKFAYALTLAPAFAVPAAVSTFRGRATELPRVASRLEIAAARAWNVINEGKPFTPIFAAGIIILLSVPRATDAGYWARAPIALLAVAPLALVFWRFDFPLRLRAALWAYLLAFPVAFRFPGVAAAALVLSLYLAFTVLLWGTVYYHLRIGTRWTNGFRFSRLVLENPDPTSGNFLEQVPKLLLLVLAFEYLVTGPSWPAFLAVEAFIVAVAASALLIHQWFFTWVPALPQPGAQRHHHRPPRTSRRVLVIAIDGCRADRLLEADTPCLDRLRAEGTDFADVSTVYPARTVTCFGSMLTGASPRVHGLRSNFVPSLGVKCESVFDVLRREGMRGALVGIAHLVDAFGHEDVRTVTAVMDNDEIDAALVARAQRVLEEEDPELLVLQLLSVDQTGHARGSYNEEYLRHIEETDRTIARFLEWCETHRYLEGATVLVTADHGQGIGIGGHGHMSPPEVRIPCILWGAGSGANGVDPSPRFITDIAPTLCHLLGVPAPEHSVGRALLPLGQPARDRTVFVVPAHNEEASLADVLDAIRRLPLTTTTIVVDDGSSDGTAAVAAAHGARVVAHASNRGLGAALRTGLEAARDLEPRAVVYLDADGEYDPVDAPALLEPIEDGRADYVVGSRFRGSIEGMAGRVRLANRAFSLLLSLLSGRWITDGQSGIRAFSPRALEVAEIVHDYNYAQVLTLDLLHKDMRMAEVPVSYRRRRAGRSFISAQYLWRVPLGMAREMLRG